MPEPDRRTPDPWIRIAILLAATVLLGIGGFELWPWISDDAFISLRYGDRLLGGDGLTWTDGERVEGYSNLLWVMLATGCRLVGFDWVTSVRVLGIAATVLTFAVILQAAWLRRRGSTPFLAVVTLGALAPTALWAIGGLETPLAMLLTVAGFVNVGTLLDQRDEAPGTRTAVLAGLCFALLAWTRPDGPLAGAFACIVVMLFARRWLGRRLLAIGGPLALAILVQLAFRLIYYGDWVPNTAHAKVGFSAVTLARGYDYIASAATILRALLIPAGLGAILGLLDRRWRPFTVLCVAFVATWTAYTAVIGGDLFPLCRILMPALGPLTLLAVLGYSLLLSMRHGVFAVCGLALLSTLGARLDANLDPDDGYQQLSRWEWQGKASGEWLGRAFGRERALLALDAAGAVPFYSQLPCLDMLGLNDRHIATAPLPYPDHFEPGHSRGDGGYVLDREPDLVLFASPIGHPSPRWPGGWQMESDPRFLRSYRCVVFRTGPVDVVGRGTEDLKLTLWAKWSGRVGLRPHAEGYVLPGYLLGSHRQPRPFRVGVPGAEALDAEGMLQAASMLQWWNDEVCVGVLDPSGLGTVAEFRRTGTVVLEDLPLSSGDYLVTPEPADAPIELELQGASETGFDLRATVRPGTPLPVAVRSVRITRR